MSLGEFDIIARYFANHDHREDVLLGVGDDAAVLAVEGHLAVTVDTLVAGVHFPDGMAPQPLGHRLMAVNLSDLAAMGAQPRWCTLALTLPAVDEQWLDGFSRGLFELAKRYGATDSFKFVNAVLDKSSRELRAAPAKPGNAS